MLVPASLVIFLTEKESFYTRKIEFLHKMKRSDEVPVYEGKLALVVEIKEFIEKDAYNG